MTDTLNFAVYSKDGCPNCSKVEKVLDLAGLNSVIYKLDKNFDKKSFFGEFGEGSTFPQVVCDGNRLGGCVGTIKFLKEKEIIKS